MYKIDYSNIKKKLILDLLAPIVSIIMVFIWKNYCSFEGGFMITINLVQWMFMLFFGCLFLISSKLLVDDLNKLYSYLILEKKGTVIKGLKYTLTDTEYGISYGGVKRYENEASSSNVPENKIIYLKANVECILPDGSTIMLESEPLFNKINNYPDKIDIIIDLDNLNNYYVGFDIPENNSKEK